ncbi:MAG: hypothetical protein ACREQB_06290 [Candidatus Binataceae bacterium]
MAGPRQPSFENIEATLLACPQCKRAVPVRKRLLIILPDGDKYEYLCPLCGATCGTKVESMTPPRRST